MSKEETIKNIIQEVIGVDIIEVTNSAHLIHDLGANESQLAEIVNRIEKAFSIILGFESFDMTVEDLLIVVFSEIKEDSLKLTGKPRNLHYTFAHKVLPALIFNEGIYLFGELRFKKGHDYMQGSSTEVELDDQKLPLKQGQEYLLNLWNALSRELKDGDIDTKGLDYEIMEKSNNLILLFLFPKPEVAGEAFCSMFVWTKEVPLEKAARYFTLELCKDNMAMIGQWTEDGMHINHDSYKLELMTPMQFIDEVLKKLMPRENKSTIDEQKDLSTNPQFLIDGLFEKEHIYLKIISAIAQKLNLPASQINKITPVSELLKQDFIDIMSDVYQMYSIDPKKQNLFIKHDVDRLMKLQSEHNLDCQLLVIKICQHFEKRIAGDYDNPKELYLDFRSKIDVISQSPDFGILYNFISQTYPSFITDNADQKKIENKSLLFKEILTIPDVHLAHNYPIDPRGLFICIVAVAIAHAEFSHMEDKMAKYLEAAVALNTKWGPFIKPVLLDNISKRAEIRKAKLHTLRKVMNFSLLRPFYRIFHELGKK